jgi:hypothetical protein
MIGQIAVAYRVEADDGPPATKQRRQNRQFVAMHDTGVDEQLARP